MSQMNKKLKKQLRGSMSKQTAQQAFKRDQRIEHVPSLRRSMISMLVAMHIHGMQARAAKAAV